MATDNQSPSYNEERERARRWFLRTPEGQYATNLLRRISARTPGTRATVNERMQRVFDDDSWTNWEDLVSEHREDVMIAASAAEARSAFDIARKASSHLGAPPGAVDGMRRIFSPPIWYVLRRQIELQEPDCWNDQRFVLEEAIANPQWACVPVDYLRGMLLAYLPKGRKLIVSSDAS